MGNMGPNPRRVNGYCEQHCPTIRLDSMGPVPHSDGEKLHAIGEVARLTGLSTHTLRVWERRYLRPRSLRLPSGHRRYSTQEVDWLVVVARAIAWGLRPSKALKLSTADLVTMTAETVDTKESSAVTKLSNALDRGKNDVAREKLLRAWSRLGPAACLGRRFAPLLASVGRRWKDGELAIHEEHRITTFVEEMLGELRGLYTTRGETAPHAVLTTLPGERHTLGLDLASVVCAKYDLRPVRLGPETPLAEIVLAAQSATAQLVGISVSPASSGPDADRMIKELREMLPEEVLLVIGGRNSKGPRRGVRDTLYFEDIEDFDQWLSETIVQLRGQKTQATRE